MFTPHRRRLRELRRAKVTDICAAITKLKAAIVAGTGPRVAAALACARAVGDADPHDAARLTFSAAPTAATAAVIAARPGFGAHRLAGRALTGDTRCAIGAAPAAAAAAVIAAGLALTVGDAASSAAVGRGLHEQVTTGIADIIAAVSERKAEGVARAAPGVGPAEACAGVRAHALTQGRAVSPRVTAPARPTAAIITAALVFTIWDTSATDALIARLTVGAAAALSAAPVISAALALAVGDAGAAEALRGQAWALVTGVFTAVLGVKAVGVTETPTGRLSATGAQAALGARALSRGATDLALGARPAAPAAAIVTAGLALTLRLAELALTSG